jgi:hypothetical protein
MEDNKRPDKFFVEKDGKIIPLNELSLEEYEQVLEMMHKLRSIHSNFKPSSLDNRADHDVQI